MTAPDFLEDIGGRANDGIKRLVTPDTRPFTRDDIIFAIADCASHILAKDSNPSSASAARLDEDGARHVSEALARSAEPRIKLH
jgi:NADH dehydrogenase FAD-containing subunit